jgi:GT2 family glycosyltransferase
MVPFLFSKRHRELADACARSVRSSHEVETIAIVNGIRSERDLVWLQERFSYVECNDTNILARAWNKGITRGLERGAELVVVSNLDLQFHPLCLDNLLECSRTNPEAVVWCPSAWRDPSTFGYAALSPEVTHGFFGACFAVNQRLFETVGPFDEGFIPAYGEDADMMYRMGRSGHQSVTCRAALVLDAERGTIQGFFECEPEDIQPASAFLLELRGKITQNDARYIRKWGGKPGQEKFTVAFNGEDGS